MLLRPVRAIPLARFDQADWKGMRKGVIAFAEPDERRA